MCGIAGIFLTGGVDRPLAEAASRMSASMRLRGPDDEGFLLGWRNGPGARPLRGPATVDMSAEPLAYTARDAIDHVIDISSSLALVHRRLSIIELSPKGHQPMCSADGRYWIVFNGEIYNFAEIRSELEREGQRFVSGSDTEVLVNAYARWQTDCLKRLNGMFAFAIWDDRDKVLFCARDRIGIKPFYYVLTEGQFIFASDIGSLLASGLHRAQPDLEGLYHGLSYGVAPRPLTAFAGVKALRQGSWMTVDAGGKSQTASYWRLPFGRQDRSMTEQAARELISDRLQVSIRRKLIADVPVGVFMSGGIDSTLIAAMASRQHPGICAFTLAFPGNRKLDESAEARATAALHPMRHVVQQVEPESVLPDLLDIMRVYEEPFYDLSPNYLVCKLAALQDMTVVLNGLGGDELFGGYAYYGWLDRWRWLRRCRPLLQVMRHVPIVRHGADRLAAVAESEDGVAFSATVRMFLTERERKRLFRDRSLPDTETVEVLRRLYIGDDVSFDDDVEAMNHMEMLNYLGNHHVYRTDAFTMHFSLEGRLPFLDHELVEAAFTVPSHFKVRNGQTKWLLRQIAGDWVAPEVLGSRKRGFDLPTGIWMKHELAETVRHKLEILSDRGIFDADEIRVIDGEWRRGLRSFRSVWQLVATEIWFETFFDNAS